MTRPRSCENHKAAIFSYVAVMLRARLDQDARSPMTAQDAVAGFAAAFQSYLADKPGMIVWRRRPQIEQGGDDLNFSARLVVMPDDLSEKVLALVEADNEEERIARVCHEAKRAICTAFGDHSQKPWNEAEQWQRDNAIRGVRFALDNPAAPPSAQHDAWMADKLADGWVYGPVKDPEAKTHPCLVPYDQLPPEQRVKDYVFKAVVAAMKASP